MTSEQSADISALLEHLREKEKRVEGMNERIAEQLDKTADRLNEVAKRVERIDERFDAHAQSVAELRLAVTGTAADPGLAVRVDRIEQAILLFRWFFGGGLVAAAAAVVVLWKFGESLSKAP